jgi:hypothetical protein
MEKFEIQGIWKGEYIYDDRFQPSLTKASIPFILRIKSIESSGLFEGMCQDDPAISQIDFPADIFGKFDGDQLIFSKRYPKTVLQDNFGKLVTVDEAQPDIIYQARLGSSDRILGTWRMERTFRKLDGKVVEIGPITGVWWMVRL